MTQFVNHTASDNINSDIRAISALQQQADDLTGRTDDLSARILEVEADVSFLKDKELIARENVRTLLKNDMDYERRLTYLETDTHAAHTKINGVINACDNYIEDVKNALLTVEKTAEKIDIRLSSLEGAMVSIATQLQATEKVMGEFKLFMGYTPSQDH